jgi:hypothetical protein
MYVWTLEVHTHTFQGSERHRFCSFSEVKLLLQPAAGYTVALHRRVCNSALHAVYLVLLLFLLA